MTIDELYEAYMDQSTSFAEDAYGFFGGEVSGLTAQEWASDYGMYLPSYDPTQVELAGRVRSLDQEKALNVLDLTKKATDRVYNTELDTLSTQLGTEMKKAKDVAGRLDLRSGSLEGAVSDTMATTSSKVKNLGDRMMIQSEKDKNTYNTTMVDTALDFDKAEHETKKDFYKRTLAMIDKMTGLGAFDKPEEEPDYCTDGQLSGSEEIISNCIGPDGEVISAGWYTGDEYLNEEGEVCTCVHDATGSVCTDQNGNDCDPVWGSGDPGWCDPSADCDNPISCCYGDSFCDEHPEYAWCQGGGSGEGDEGDWEGPSLDCCLLASDPDACNANPEAYGCGGDSNVCTSSADCSCPSCYSATCMDGVCDCYYNPFNC